MTSSLWRIAVFISALLMLSFIVQLAFGIVLPWTFFAFMTVLALACARPRNEDHAPLLREAERSPGHRSSTGCYPHNGSQ